MANPVSSLLVRIGADTSGLESGGRRASKSMDELAAQAAKLGKTMAAIGAAATAAGAAITAGLVKSGLSAIDSQAKLARSLDGTIDGLRTLQLAAQDAGVPFDAMGANVQRMNRRLGEMATTGAGPAAAWIERLGLNAQELLKLPLDDRVARISDEISNLATGAQMASAAFAIFGDGGLKMVPMLQQGGDAIRAARQEVEAYGLSLSEVDAAKVEQANTAMAKIGRVMEAIRNQITVAFAPLLEELANRFNAVARENKGFADVARSTAEAVITGMAKVADAVHVLQTAFKGIELVVVNLKASQITVAEAIIRMWAGVGDAIMAVVNAAIRGLNSLGASIDEIPSLSKSKFVTGLKEMGAQARAEIGQVRMELVDLVTAEWPSKKAEEFLAAVRKRAQEAAEAVADVGGGLIEFDESEKDQKERERLEKELEAQRAALDAKLNQVIQYGLSERDLEVMRHEERLAILRESLEQELLTKEEFDIAARVLEEKHMEAMKKIREKGMTAMERFMAMSFANQAKTVAAGLADMTAALARDSRTMFEINKVAGIANATVAMFQGIAEGLKLGWPRSIPAVAYAAAQGAAAIAGIKAQSFGGSGAAPSVAGTAPATPVTPVTGGTPQSAAGGALLTIEGVSEDHFFSGRQLRDLAERLQEHMRDGGSFQFAS